MSAEENLKTEAEDIISDQINMEEETNVKSDLETEPVILNPIEKNELTEDEMEMKIKEIVNSLKKF
ncbi:MAG: hypothetical protein IPH77_19815 [Ignavibacteria bacterium]|jgi:hypothetical protein|nr:hypothetical protein [Ignavibacteria bacterium]